VGYRLVRDCLESSEPQTAVPSPAGHSDELARSLHDLPSTQRDVLLLHAALMASSGHRANILDRNVSQVGVGVTVRNGTVWVTQVFRSPTGSAVLSGSSSSSSSSSVSPFPGGFSDVDRRSTHGANIERLRKAKVTSGCGSNRYCPNRSVSRAEMASFLVRSLNLPAAKGNRFRDVSSSNSHRADINALAQAGITRGSNPPNTDRFCPNDPVTRAEMASFLARAKNLPATSSRPFRDIGGSPHAADINRLARSGITRGCNPPTNNRYCPRDRVTRAEMATFLVRGFSY
jgi:hypothetical protein